MGYLNNFNLDSYGCDAYVETGTGNCVTLSKAHLHFDNIYSVDLDPTLVRNARSRFPKSTINEGLSTEVLDKWLKDDLSNFESILFFFDAHFPGSDFYGVPYSVTAPNAVPLEEELRLLKKYRPNARDVIICDDARIYTSGPFQNGNTDWLQVPGGYQFVYDFFPDAKISLSYDEEGYIIIDRR